MIGDSLTFSLLAVVTHSELWFLAAHCALYRYIDRNGFFPYFKEMGTNGDKQYEKIWIIMTIASSALAILLCVVEATISRGAFDGSMRAAAIFCILMVFSIIGTIVGTFLFSKSNFFPRITVLSDEVICNDGSNDTMWVQGVACLQSQEEVFELPEAMLFFFIVMFVYPIFCRVAVVFLKCKDIMRLKNIKPMGRGFVIQTTNAL